MEPIDPPTESGTTPPPPPSPPTGSPGNPFERRSELGFFQGLVDAIKGFITSPGVTFAETKRSGDLLSPLLYAVIVGFIGTAISSIWQALMGTAWTQYLPPEMQDQWGLGWAAMGTAAGILGWLLVAPFFIVIGIFIVAAIVHLSLMLVGGLKNSRAGFEGTLRVVAYSQTASLAQIIPFLGGLITLIWTLVLGVMGIVRLHDTTEGRAAIGVLLPMLLCCFCIVAVIAFGFMGMISAFASQ